MRHELLRPVAPLQPHRVERALLVPVAVAFVVVKLELRVRAGRDRHSKRQASLRVGILHDGSAHCNAAAALKDRYRVERSGRVDRSAGLVSRAGAYVIPRAGPPARLEERQIHLARRDLWRRHGRYQQRRTEHKLVAGVSRSLITGKVERQKPGHRVSFASHARSERIDVR